jgi:hypothetical protein
MRSLDDSDRDARFATKAIAGNGTNRHDRNGDFSA